MDIYILFFSIFKFNKERAAAGLCLPTHLRRCSRVSSLCSRRAGWILRFAACLLLGGALLPALLPLCTALHCSWGKVNTQASTSPSLLVNAEITFPGFQTVAYRPVDCLSSFNEYDVTESLRRALTEESECSTGKWNWKISSCYFFMEESYLKYPYRQELHSLSDFDQGLKPFSQ